VLKFPPFPIKKDNLQNGMALCQVYYKAQKLAINNNRAYHVAAILRRNGRVIKIGENTSKTHPRFKRQYPDGTFASHMHAEMNVLRFAEPGDKIEVLRFKKGGVERSMAKPCHFCQSALKKAGVLNIRYTDWDGKWRNMSL